MALLALSSCSGGTGVSGAGEPTLEQRLQLSGEAAEINFNLMQEGIRACMANQGFEFIPGRLSARQYVPYPTIGSWTEDRARDYGLAVVTTIRGTFDEHDGQSFKQEVVDSIEGRDNKILWVDTLSECQEQVGESLNGDWTRAVDALLPLYEDMVFAFIADPRHVSIQAEWSSCFADTGFGQFETMDDLVASQYEVVDLLDRHSEDELTDAEETEKQLALAAVRCAAPLRDRWQTVWDEYESDFLESNEVPQIPVTAQP